MGMRNCEIVQQIKYLPGGSDKWKETLEEKLNSNKRIVHWCYIVHDKDTDENGNPKEPHIHLLLVLDDSYESSTIGGYVGVEKNFVQKIKQKQFAGRRMKSDIGGAISYLTHRNAPDKHQYDDSEVVAQPGYDWQAIRAKSEALQAENKSYRNVLEKIEQGEIRHYNLMDNVSMAMYMAHKLDFERAFEYREAKLKSNPNRKIDVIYISGDPGAGKTTLAKQLCEKRGLSYCLSGSTRDPVQDYDGQDALILDDLRSEAFPLSDLLKLLDNNSNSSVSARYHDRWLEVKLIIVTTVLPIQRFHELYCNPSEPVEQLMRRCTTAIDLSISEMCVCSYEPKKREYRLIGKGRNPILPQYRQDVQDKKSRLVNLCNELGVSYIEDYDSVQPSFSDVTGKIDLKLFTG